MLELLLLRHLLLQGWRIAVVLFLFATLWGLGILVLRLLRTSIADPRERLLLEIACGFALYQFVVRWLGELPAGGPAGVMAVTAILAAIALAGMRGRIGHWRDAMVRLRVPAGPRMAGLLLLSLPPLFMALAPSVSRDAEIYHLRFPEMTLRAGRWAYDLANSASFYPSATGTLYLPALAADAEGVAAQLIHFGFFVLCLGAAAAIARRLGAPTGLDAALLLAALPVVAIVAGWAWADLSFLFALFAALIAFFSGAWGVCGLLLGLSVAAKYSALLAAIPICLAWLAGVLRTRSWRGAAAGIALGLGAMSPWLVTNLMRTGNPIFPLASSHPGPGRIATWTPFAGQSRLEVWTGYLLHPRTLDDDAGGLLFLAVAISGLVLGLRRRSTRIAAIGVLGLWALFAPLTTSLRLVLPAVAATAVLSGAVLEQVSRRRLAAVLVTAFAVRGGLLTAAHNAHFRNPLPAAVGIETAESYVRRNLPITALFARAGAVLPPDARVLSFREERLFRFPRSVSASRAFDPPLMARYVKGPATPREVIRRMRADGFTHLLVASRPEAPDRPLPLPEGGDALVGGVIRSSRLIAREGSTALLELPRL